jgi:drug/metabolite transporter (DMT)-like permease
MSEPQNPTVQDWLLLAALALLWGTAFLFIRFSLDSQPPVAVSTIRLALGAVALLAVAHLRGRKMPPLSDVRWRHFALLGFFGNALPFFLIPLGQTEISSALAGILVAVMPLATVVLAYFFANERLTKWKLIGFVAGFAGVIVLIGPAALANLGGADTLFQLIVLGAGLSYAVNAVLTRRAPKTPASVLAAGTLTCAAIMSLPFGIWAAWQNELPASVLGWSSLVWLGLGPTAIATLIFMRIIARAGAGFLSLVNYIVPVIALLTGLAFGESVSWNAYLGLAIILGGIALARRR